MSVNYQFLTVVILGTVVAHYLANTAYNLFFHPLSKYPGPCFARFSAWPSFYHTARGDRHIWLWRLHQVYGPIVRYRHDSVAITTPEALRAIYDSSSNVRKSHSYNVWHKKAEAPNTFSSIDKTRHAQRRRILNAAMSDKTVKSAQGYVIKHTDRWLELLSTQKSEWSEPRNMCQWSDNLQFDLMSELCFGKPVGTMEPGENNLRSIPHDIAEWMWLTFRIMHSPFSDIWIWPKPRGLDALFARYMPKPIKHCMKFVEEGVAKRLDQEEQSDKNGEESERKDMFHYLFQAIDPDTGRRGWSRQDLLEEADMLTIAATDTTAAAIASAFFYLSRHKIAYEKLEKEICSTFPTADDIKIGPKLSGCEYLYAIINETLRMSPSGMSEFPREVLPGGIQVEGEYFPSGVNIGCAFYALFHSENVYGDPSIFRPERWLIGNGVSEADVAEAKKAFAPFSLGARGCPGKSLALMEMSMVFARLLHGYDFRFAPGDKTGEGDANMGWGRQNKRQYQTRDAFVPLRDGPVSEEQLPIRSTRKDSEYGVLRSRMSSGCEGHGDGGGRKRGEAVRWETLR
ncbi:cytochrome P450 monooxygenase-like protein [Massariosphaeria phaeospora]|uniref:Cytochrome P450 monooxygenase-like protein n=1 Tax=Massariosphaeria phaeospora TaxID=100035 RepID=A0A7C8IFU0_9PLEO|nr:cytochrome P450 monooxygenase-like protein [Massariosphaeria phaeospora]